MANDTLLQKRPTGYYYRQIVPNDLKPILGKQEIVKSLHTKNPKEAASKHKTLALEFDALFQRLRNGDTEVLERRIVIPSSANQTTLQPQPVSLVSNATSKGHRKTLRDVYTPQYYAPCDYGKIINFCE